MGNWAPWISEGVQERVVLERLTPEIVTQEPETMPRSLDAAFRTPSRVLMAGRAAVWAGSASG
jgi:hypothetical protein